MKAWVLAARSVLETGTECSRHSHEVVRRSSNSALQQTAPQRWLYVAEGLVVPAAHCRRIADNASRWGRFAPTRVSSFLGHRHYRQCFGQCLLHSSPLRDMPSAAGQQLSAMLFILRRSARCASPIHRSKHGLEVQSFTRG